MNLGCVGSRVSESLVGIGKDAVPVGVGEANFAELVVCPFVWGSAIVGIEGWVGA